MNQALMRKKLIVTTDLGVLSSYGDINQIILGVKDRDMN